MAGCPNADARAQGPSPQSSESVHPPDASAAAIVPIDPSATVAGAGSTRRDSVLGPWLVLDRPREEGHGASTGRARTRRSRARDLLAPARPASRRLPRTPDRARSRTQGFDLQRPERRREHRTTAHADEIPATRRVAMTDTHAGSPRRSPTADAVARRRLAASASTAARRAGRAVHRAAARPRASAAETLARQDRGRIRFETSSHERRPASRRRRDLDAGEADRGSG